MYDDPATGPAAYVSDDEGDRPARDSTENSRPPAIDEDRSPNAWVCAFLRSIDDDDALGLPVESPDPANRCAALSEAVPQSLRQQELVCLTSGHVNCPRYLRGSPGTNEPPVGVAAARALTPAIVASLAVFVAAFLVSVSFVVANGGLVLTAAVMTPTASAEGFGAIAPGAKPTPTQTAIPTQTAMPTLTPTPIASAEPTQTPAPSASMTPSPTANVTPKPTSNRYALLTPCPDAPNCYLYVIRSGDNLYSISNYFVIPLNTVQAMNPWTANGLTVGRALRLPPPTR